MREGHGLQPCRPNLPAVIGTSGTRALPGYSASAFPPELQNDPSQDSNYQSCKSRSSPILCAGTISRKNSAEKFFASSWVHPSGVFWLRNNAICTSRRNRHVGWSLTSTNNPSGARGFMSAWTISGSVSCLLLRAGEIIRWSDDCSKAAATRPDARLAKVIFWPRGRDSSRVISCSSAARFTSGTTAGIKAKFIRSNVNMLLNSGIETWRGVRGCEASATRTLRLFDAIGFLASCANLSAVASGLFSSASASSSLRPFAERLSEIWADGMVCSAFPDLSVEWGSVGMFTQRRVGVNARATPNHSFTRLQL
jgi:hypothetical protein